jgi:hypothetical protein
MLEPTGSRRPRISRLNRRWTDWGSPRSLGKGSCNGSCGDAGGVSSSRRVQCFACQQMKREYLVVWSSQSFHFARKLVREPVVTLLVIVTLRMYYEKPSGEMTCVRSPTLSAARVGVCATFYTAPTTSNQRSGYANQVRAPPQLIIQRIRDQEPPRPAWLGLRELKPMVRPRLPDSCNNPSSTTVTS